MRLITVSGLALSLALSAAPAFAAKAAKDQSVAEESASAATAERKVCKRLENTGTRMKNDRVCLTKEEWRKLDDVK